MTLRLDWKRLGDELPEIAQDILLAKWDADLNDWRVRDAMLLVRHEGVRPRIADMAKGLPTDWWFASIYPGHTDIRPAKPDHWWSPVPKPGFKLGEDH